MVSGEVTGLRKLAMAVAVMFGALVLAAAAAGIFIALDRDAFIDDLLRAVSAATGTTIQARNLNLRFAPTGIEVIADRVRVAHGGKSGTAQRFEAIVAYSELMRFRFLPLESIVLATPTTTLTGGRKKISASQYAPALCHLAKVLSGLSWQIAIKNGRFGFPNLGTQSSGTPVIVIDSRIQTDSSGASVRLSRLEVLGTSLDGLLVSGNLTVPATATKNAEIRGALRFSHARAPAFRASLGFALSDDAVLQGRLTLATSVASPSSRVGFEGSYRVSPRQVRIDGLITIPNGRGVDGQIPAHIIVKSPLSSASQVLASSGPFEIQLAQAMQALSSKPSAISGTLVVRSAQFTTDLSPWRAALRGCSDMACRRRQALAILLRDSTLAISIAGADVSDPAWPRGAQSISLERQLQLRVEDGVAKVNKMTAQIGAVHIDGADVEVKTARIQNGLPSRLRYTAAFPVTVDLGRLEAEHAPPARIRSLIPTRGSAFAEVHVSGSLGISPRRKMRPQYLRVALSEGMLRLRDRKTHETVYFHSDASLRRGTIRSSARVFLLEGGTFAINSRFALASRTLHASIRVHNCDLRRWSRALVKVDGSRSLKVWGEAAGRLNVAWRIERAKPALNASAVVTALTIDSPFTKSPVMVRSSRFAYAGGGAQLWLDGVMLGAGEFNVHGTLTDPAKPAIAVSLTGDTLDLDPINLKGARAAHPSAAPASFAPALSARVLLHAAYFHGVRMENVSARIRDSAGRLSVRGFHAHALGGSISFGAQWNPTQQLLHVVGGVRTVETGRVFAVIDAARARKPLLTGALSARLNAGIRIGGAAKRPELSCGGATLAISRGRLAGSQLIAQILEVLSLRSWLRFKPPDLDASGIPFNKLIAHLAFSPGALTVQHVQLTGSVVRVAGHGNIALPANVLNLQLAILPFTSTRWMLDYLPLVGARIGSQFDRVFAVRMDITGPSSDPSISPQLFNTTVDALVQALELPLEFVPDIELPSATSLAPAPSLADSPGCVPPWQHASSRAASGGVPDQLPKSQLSPLW